mmetsp:Transcript_46292/g.100664  ORF Transcript_46292/g.100664 Transcript_46292/m.100664 type:complete len:436 (-) Transcript_46292:80-1387(-)
MGKPKELWILGIGLEILSTLSGTMGKQLIRLSELSRRSAPRCANSLFTAGLLVNTIAGPILDMAAYSFAAQSLIAPFGGLDVIWNAALAPYILKETLTRSRLQACGLIFIGTVLSGVFGSHEDEEQYTLALLEEKLLSWRLGLYVVCLILFVAFNILVPMRRPKKDLIRGISLGVTAGSIAGNMFCVKAGVELIETSIWNQEGEIWTNFFPYAVLVGAAFFALSNVYFLTQGLLEFEALFMVTIYEGSMIVANCISAAVVLLELEMLPLWRVTLYSMCVAMVCLGMVSISWTEAWSVSKRSISEVALSSDVTIVGGSDATMQGDVEMEVPLEEGLRQCGANQRTASKVASISNAMGAPQSLKTKTDTTSEEATASKVECSTSSDSTSSTALDAGGKTSGRSSPADESPGRAQPDNMAAVSTTEGPFEATELQMSL